MDTEEWEVKMWESKEQKLGNLISFKFREIFPFHVNLSGLFPTVKEKFIKFKIQF